MAERFVFEISVEGDKSEGHYVGYRTKVARTISISIDSPARLPEALATLVNAAVTEIIDELIERDERAEKETEE